MCRCVQVETGEINSRPTAPFNPRPTPTAPPSFGDVDEVELVFMGGHHDFQGVAEQPRGSPGQSNNEAYLCVVCLDKEITHMIEECGHAVLCERCVNVINSNHGECPLCRQAIVRPPRRLFLP